MLRLTREDVERFAAASGDQNPLHVSPEYARTTAFGQRIAHGVLGLLTAARALPDRPGQRLRKLAVEFPRPMLLDTDYAVEVNEDGPDACALEVRDGSKSVLRGMLEFSEGRASRLTEVEPTLRNSAAELREFSRGQTVSGTYFARLPELAGKGIGEPEAAALALCSAVIGMELPGELALFTRLALEFEPDPPASGELRWTARVDTWQPRTGSLKIGLELRLGDAPWAKGSLRAFVRADAGADVDDIRSEHLGPDAFAGKTALIIGASRGLGRSLARGFAAHGGQVFSVSRSTPEHPDPGITSLLVDAADPEQLGSALEQLDRIDVLVCNASPPLQPLMLEPATLARVQAHIHQAVALVSTPLALCLSRLAASHGVALLSSSQAVESPPAEWAHYVAGKRAAEGLFEVAALQYPDVGFLVARMPRLDTAFSLNVSGEPAASTRSVALSLLERIATERRGFEIISTG